MKRDKRDTDKVIARKGIFPSQYAYTGNKGGTVPFVPFAVRPHGWWGVLHSTVRPNWGPCGVLRSHRDQRGTGVGVPHSMSGLKKRTGVKASCVC